VSADLPASRVDHHRAARASERVDGTAQRVRQDKAGVGDLRGCDPPRAGRVQSEERRTGTARWRKITRNGWGSQVRRRTNGDDKLMGYSVFIG